MSGGVDSSVTALLLKQQGYEVVGLFMQNWEADADDPHCSAEMDLTDARMVCDRLEIPLHTVNFSREYWDRVFQYFLDEYAASRTPNPDVMCNQEIKFKAFLDHALKMGADKIAMGHYVRTNDHNDQVQLLKGLDANKDQSYFLYRLNQHQLSNALFPIGELEKSQVRKLAEENGLLNHSKKDSTGICFIGERRFKTFLQEYLLAQPGFIEDETGKILGKHDGVIYYTLGQRKGLNIGGQKDADEKPWYVIQKDIQRNVLIVAQNHNHDSLLTNTLICKDINWIQNTEPSTNFKGYAKTRYRQSDQRCIVTKKNEIEYEVIFEEKQWAVTPGQSVVFYDGEICLGGGIIQ